MTGINIPGYLGIRPRDWKRLIAEGIAPVPDGERVTPSGERQSYWYKETIERFLKSGRIPVRSTRRRTRD